MCNNAYNPTLKSIVNTFLFACTCTTEGPHDQVNVFLYQVLVPQCQCTDVVCIVEVCHNNKEPPRHVFIVQFSLQLTKGVFLYFC